MITELYKRDQSPQTLALKCINFIHCKLINTLIQPEKGVVRQDKRKLGKSPDRWETEIGVDITGPYGARFSHLGPHLCS